MILLTIYYSCAE